jgi:hypothetical protein
MHHPRVSRYMQTDILMTIDTKKEAILRNFVTLALHLTGAWGGARVATRFLWRVGTYP